MHSGCGVGRSETDGSGLNSMENLREKMEGRNCRENHL